MVRFSKGRQGPSHFGEGRSVVSLRRNGRSFIFEERKDTSFSRRGGSLSFQEGNVSLSFYEKRKMSLCFNEEGNVSLL